MEKKEFQFDFVVSGITKELADAILDLVVAIAESVDAQVGGGFAVAGEDDDGEKTS